MNSSTLYDRNIFLTLLILRNQDGHSVVPLEEAYDGTIQNFTDEDGMGPILPPTGNFLLEFTHWRAVYVKKRDRKLDFLS